MATFYHDGYGDKKNRGDQTLRMEKTGTQNIMPSGFSYNVSSLKVDPGYELCIYDRPYLQSSHPGELVGYCTGETQIDELWKIPRLKWDWNNTIASFTLKKDCNHPKFMWDKDCIYGDKKHTTGNCNDKQGQCHRNRIIHCNLSDDPSHECLNFCNQNHGSCDMVMKKFCALPYNADKEECACINSPGAKFGPACFDNRCVNLGYQTKKMMDEKCPHKTDCELYYRFKDKVDFTDGTMHDRCAQSQPEETQPEPEQKLKTKVEDTSVPAPPVKPTDPVSKVTKVSKISNDNNKSSSSSMPTWLIIVLSVLTVIIMVLIIYILFRKGSAAPARSAFNTSVAPLLKRIRN